MIYAILLNPGHNRIYFEAALKLSASEFRVATKNLPNKFKDIEHRIICGIDYLTFTTAGELTLTDIKTISGMSFFYALFELKNIDNDTYFKPINEFKEHYVDESISSILKYTGKTNEIFTRMMINIACAARGGVCDGGGSGNGGGIVGGGRSNNCDSGDRGRSSGSGAGRTNLLDPVAGKGTTLYEGLIKGFDVYGIEIGDKITNEIHHYVKRFLETAKYKHEYTPLKISGPGKSFTAQRHTFKIAKSKEEYKNKETKIFEVVAGNSLYANKYYKKDFFDIIVGDLPYGVQHGSVTNEKQSSMTRNPAELLNACLPSWLDVLKPGGSIVLAWNINILPRAQIEHIFEENGLAVLRDDIYMQFEHRVDQAILRDIITAVKIPKR